VPKEIHQHPLFRKETDAKHVPMVCAPSIEPVPGDVPQKLPEGHRRPHKPLGGTRVAGRGKPRQRALQTVLGASNKPTLPKMFASYRPNQRIKHTMTSKNKHPQTYKRGDTVRVSRTDFTDHIRGVLDGMVGEVVEGEVRPDPTDKHWVYPPPLVRFETEKGPADLWMGMHQLAKYR
jgi:hypothetical protein